MFLDIWFLPHKISCFSLPPSTLHNAVNPEMNPSFMWITFIAKLVFSTLRPCFQIKSGFFCFLTLPPAAEMVEVHRICNTHKHARCWHESLYSVGKGIHRHLSFLGQWQEMPMIIFPFRITLLRSNQAFQSFILIDFKRYRIRDKIGTTQNRGGRPWCTGGYECPCT